MAIVYSYIGKAPVYSDQFKCHIWTSPLPTITEVEIELPESNERAQYRHIVRDCLAEHGPLTARMIADKTGLHKHQINSALNSNKGTMFLLLCNTHFVWGLITHTLNDVRFIVKPHMHTAIAAYLKTVETATSKDIEAYTGICHKQAVVVLGKHSELFQMVGSKGHAKCWKLRGAA